MSPSVESLAERYSRFETPDLKAIVEAPEGDYLPEARAAARAELERRARSGEPAELPEVPVARQSRAITFLAVFMIFIGGSLLFQGAFLLLSLLLSPAWDLALWAAGLLLAGLLLTYMASVIDRAFWDHFVKTYAVVGVLRAGSAGLLFALGTAKDRYRLLDVLQGALMVVVALAVHVWRRRRKALPQISPVRPDHL